ncbi:MAG: hypothetical protein ACE5GW_07670, partial [Planctomycetota bacterium]
MKTRAHRAWQKLPAMLLSLLFVLSPLTGGTVLSGADSSLSASALDLIEETPGLRAFHDEEGRVAFYGRPMEGAVSAGSPEEAADLWIESRRDALGAGEVDLELLRFNEIQRGRFTVFAYAQWLDGLPVEDARARVLVLNGEEPVVVYAAARLAAAPPDGLPPLGIAGESALASLLGLDEARGLTRWSPPELVVLPSWLAGGSSIEAWKIGAAGTDPATPGYRARTFFVDAASGRLAHARDDIHNIDVTGNVSGMATPGALPDAGGNTPVATDLEAARVRIIGGALVFTDEQGNFVIPNPGSGTVNVNTTLVGPWTEVFNQGGSDLSITEPVLPPGPIDLLFNATPSQFNTAQVNGFFHTVATHEFFKDRAP